MTISLKRNTEGVSFKIKLVRNQMISFPVLSFWFSTKTLCLVFYWNAINWRAGGRCWEKYREAFGGSSWPESICALYMRSWKGLTTTDHIFSIFPILDSLPMFIFVFDRCRFQEKCESNINQRRCWLQDGRLIGILCSM